MLILELNHFGTITAVDGKDALEKLDLLKEDKRILDLIISDIMMPKMNGYDFFKKISKSIHWNTIPFIFLTALASPEEVRLGKLFGVDDYIVKPFTEDDLLSSVKEKLSMIQK